MATNLTSIAERLASLPVEERLAAISELSEDEAQTILYTWRVWARPDQLEPKEEYDVWLLLGGRGSGKTRTGAETVRSWIEDRGLSRLAFVAETKADTRDVMVEGESGLLAISPPWNYPNYEPSKRLVTWPNGAEALLFSGDDPDQLRGPQFEAAWVDELAKFRYAQQTWDNLELSVRLGFHPRKLVTTTPRNIQVIKDLVVDPYCITTKSTTFDNIPNLAAPFIRRVIGRFKGTRMGRQELYAHILEDVEGAIFTHARNEEHRVLTPPPFERVVVAVDPAVGKGDDVDEVGISVCGKGVDGHGYTLADLSGDYASNPAKWGKLAVDAYHEFKASKLVAEVNQGGVLVEQVCRSVDDSINYDGIHASERKEARAEPVAGLDEQGKIHHVGGFAKLEDQQTSMTARGFKGTGSPDRLDAWVYAMTELMFGASPWRVSKVSL